MFKNIKMKNIIIAIIVLFVIWFIFFRTKQLTISYDGVDTVATGAVYRTTSFAPKTKMANTNRYMADMSVSNALSAESLTEDVELDEAAGANQERYRENKYYRVDTSSFENIVEDLTTAIKELNGTIKINQQNSNKRVEYDKEFYPRYQNIEFTIDNSEKDLEKIDNVLKKWGNIRISNSNMTSIEQELVNYEQQLKEMEEARKALKESKDKDWIARQDASLAKESERIKNQIENAKKQSTYKTYTVDIYEIIKFNVNALRYWYDNNYSLKNAVDNFLPKMVAIFAYSIPITLMVLIFIFALSILYTKTKNKMFNDKLKSIKNEFDDSDIHFDIKM